MSDLSIQPASRIVRAWTLLLVGLALMLTVVAAPSVRAGGSTTTDPGIAAAGWIAQTGRDRCDPRRRIAGGCHPRLRRDRRRPGRRGRCPCPHRGRSRGVRLGRGEPAPGGARQGHPGRQRPGRQREQLRRARPRGRPARPARHVGTGHRPIRVRDRSSTRRWRCSASPGPAVVCRPAPGTGWPPRSARAASTSGTAPARPARASRIRTRPRWRSRRCWLPARRRPRPDRRRGSWTSRRATVRSPRSARRTRTAPASRARPCVPPARPRLPTRPPPSSSRSSSAAMPTPAWSERSPGRPPIRASSSSRRRRRSWRSGRRRSTR